jgi:mRNA interferase MazF
MMQPMTGYSRGEVVLVAFTFTDESGAKRRPALVVNSETYSNDRDEVVIAAITSTTDRILVGDHLIADWHTAGLLFPSVATGIIRTIKQSMIDRRLGKMTISDMTKVDLNLRLIFRIS